MTRAEAYEYLKGKKVAELKEIAKEGNIYLGISPNKSKMIERIIDATIGLSERSEAIKSLSLRGR